MQNHQIVSLVSGCCLLLAGVFIVVPLITNNWVVVSMNIKIGPLVTAALKLKNITQMFGSLSHLGGSFMPKMPNMFPPRTRREMNFVNLTKTETVYPEPVMQNSFMTPQLLQIMEKVSVNVDISVGLKKGCLDLKIHGLQGQFKAMANSKMPKFPCKKFTWLSNMMTLTTLSLSKDIQKLNMGEAFKRDLKVINNLKSTMNTVFTCMLIALFAVVLAIISSTVKSPCVKYRKKNLMVYLTIALCVVAGIFCMSAVILVNKDIKLEHDMKVSVESTKNYPVPGGNLEMKKFLHEVVDMFKIKETKGVAFGLVCGAIAVLFVVFLLNVLEYFLARSKAEDEYGIGLVSNKDYSLAETM